MKITKTIRDGVRHYLNDHAWYDPHTMRITRCGMVTAKISPNKWPGSSNSCRFMITHALTIVDENGKPRFGY